MTSVNETAKPTREEVLIRALDVVTTARTMRDTREVYAQFCRQFPDPAKDGIVGRDRRLALSRALHEAAKRVDEAVEPFFGPTPLWEEAVAIAAAAYLKGG